MVASLGSIIQELAEADRQERMDLLVDFAKRLPPLPERLEARKDASHRVEECLSPVYLFVESDGDRIALHADVPIEAATARSFVSILIEGLDGKTAEEILAVPNDLVHQAGLGEILGMRRVGGLSGVLVRLKREVARAVSSRTGTSSD